MNVTAEIERRIASFVADLDGLVRSAALEAVQAALGGEAPAAKAAPAKAAPTNAAKAPAKPAVVKAPKAAAAPKARKAAEADQKLVDAVAKHIAKHSGHGAATIATYLGVPSKDLALPLATLLEAKRITKKGKTRGTRYFAVK